MTQKSKLYFAPYKNPLHKAMWSFFNRTSTLNALLHQTAVWHKAHLNEANSKTYHLKGITTITSNDLTSEVAPNQEAELNVIRAITREEYVDFISNISNKEASYAIGQTYEYFETLIYDTLAAYVKFKDKAYSGKRKLIEIRSELKSKFKSRNNAEAFKFIRQESETYKKYEENNTSSLNLIDWYSVFSLVRHAITHAESNIKRADYDKLSNAQRLLLHKFFHCKICKEYVALKPDYITFREVVKCTHSHAFLIFKGLSETLGLESFLIFAERLPRPSTKQ